MARELQSFGLKNILTKLALQQRISILGNPSTITMELNENSNGTEADKSNFVSIGSILFFDG